MGLIIGILMGALAGFVAGKIMKGGGFGFILNLIIGIIGGFLGSLVFGLVGIGAHSVIGQFIVSVVGACLLLWIVSLIKK